MAGYEKRESSLTEETLFAIRDAERARALVEVSETVVQKVRLGERELERRAKRRAVRAARKKNR